MANTGSSIGLKGSVQVAKAMAGTVYDLANDASLIAEAKKEFMVRRGGKAYCSIEKLFGRSGLTLKEQKILGKINFLKKNFFPLTNQR